MQRAHYVDSVGVMRWLILGNTEAEKKPQHQDNSIRLTLAQLKFRDPDPSSVKNVHVTFLQYLCLSQWGSYEINTAVQYVLQLILCSYDLILHLCVCLQFSRL